MSLWDVPLRELYLLLQMLAKDPTSRLMAAQSGWERPVSHEWLILADLYDLQRAKASKRRSRPYPRPTTKRTKLGGNNKRRRSPLEVLKLLRPHREKPPAE